MKLKLLFSAAGLILTLIVLTELTQKNTKSLPEELQQQLIHSASFEALALNPEQLREAADRGTNTDTLLGYQILGHLKIDDENTRRDLVTAVSKDIARANHPPTECRFEPRHGIRCVDGTNTILIAICYHCGDVAVKRNADLADYLVKMNGALGGPASRQLFEALFRKAGIKTDEP